ncbi:MAG TPA: PqqD family protein [Chthonomonadaceae bacterium]|nr:PqqD family protein [Chthonomonadaceae bacterium]
MRLPLKTRLYYTVGRHLPFLKIRPPDIDRRAVLTLRPGRNSVLSWEKQESGETILTVPMKPQGGRMGRAMAKWFRIPENIEKRVELDEVGGYVWELCDGSHTVEAIVQKTGRHYKMNRREAEVSVTMFLQMLHERHFIAFYKKVSKRA